MMPQTALFYTDALDAGLQASTEDLIATRLGEMDCCQRFTEERIQELAGDLLMEILAIFRPDLVTQSTPNWHAWTLDQGLAVLRRYGLAPEAGQTLARICFDMTIAEIVGDVITEQRWTVLTRLARTDSQARTHYGALHTACQAFLAAQGDRP